MAQHIDATYPTIARWVMEYGWIEISHDDMSPSFVRALNEGGLVWEGQEDSVVENGVYDHLRL
jgi:hypothetical protein